MIESMAASEAEKSAEKTTRMDRSKRIGSVIIASRLLAARIEPVRSNVAVHRSGDEVADRPAGFQTGPEVR